VIEEVRAVGERMGQEYRKALAEAQECERFWRMNMFVGPADELHRFPTSTPDNLLQASRMGNPDAAWRIAMNKLAIWRQFRAAHGMP
jgi:hypothetical protein